MNQSKEAQRRVIMKSTIKFRCWDDNLKAMVVPDFITHTGEVYTLGHAHMPGLYQPHKVDNVTLMRWIGTKDKKGKEIYEGDIVKWDDRSKGKFWRVAVVLMEPDIQFQIIRNTLHDLSTHYPKTFEFGSFIYTDTHNHLTVVGNIFENADIILP